MNEQPASYPPAPWVLRGTAWLALLRTARPMAVPEGLAPIGDPHRILVLSVHYTSGTLTYHELAVNSLVRRNGVPGLYVHHIWVDDERSMWGGREIWGLDKKLATFSMSDDSTVVTAPDGTLTELRFTGRSRVALPVVGLLFGYGRRDGRWIRATATVRARAGFGRCQVRAWSACLPELADADGRSVRMAFGRMKVH